MERKRPNLVIFWHDTRELLTHRELDAIRGAAFIVDVTPLETLLHVRNSNRKVVIRGVSDPAAPPVPT